MSPGQKLPKVHTLSTALDKARKFCAYQERSQQEVRDKLYDLGLHKNEVEQGISQLIGEGFINEERFAQIFAGGKFRMKQWGKVKITLELQKKKISPYCIRKALEAIDERDYRHTLEEVIRKKKRELKGGTSLKNSYALARFAISRGFEPPLVWEILKKDGFEEA